MHLHKVISLITFATTNSFTQPRRVLQPFHRTQKEQGRTNYKNNWNSIIAMSTAEPKLKRAKVEDSEASPVKSEHPAEDKSDDGGKEGEETSAVEILKNDSGESYIDISAKKRVTIRKWRDNVLIDIREVS